MHKKLGCDSSVYVCLVPGGEINNLRIFIFIRMLRCYIFRFKGNKQFSNLHFDGRGAAKHPWSCPLFVLPTQSFLSFETGEDVVTLYQQERDILTHQKALWDTPFSCSSLTPEKHHEFVSSFFPKKNAGYASNVVVMLHMGCYNAHSERRRLNLDIFVWSNTTLTKFEQITSKAT